MQVKFVNYAKSYLAHKKEYDRAMQNALNKGNLILREDVEKFEENLAKFVGTKYAIFVDNGTNAIELCLRAIGVNNKCIVSVPSHTFKSTCSAVLKVGAKPIIYDMDSYKKDLNVDVHLVAHIAGEIYPIPEVYEDLAIEDSAQALGAIKNPKSFAQTWSFYPAKILGGIDESGAITTNSKNLYDYVRGYRNHFKETNEDFGGNYRAGDVCASYLNVKFKYIDEILERREEIAMKYWDEIHREQFGWNTIILPNKNKKRVWQDFIVMLPKEKGYKFWGRDNLYNFLKKQGIETMKNEYPWSPEYPKLPLAAKYESETLRLPCNENLKDKEVNYVIKKVNEFFR